MFEKLFEKSFRKSFEMSIGSAIFWIVYVIFVCLWVASLRLNLIEQLKEDGDPDYILGATEWIIAIMITLFPVVNVIIYIHALTQDEENKEQIKEFLLKTCRAVFLIKDEDLKK